MNTKNSTKRRLKIIKRVFSHVPSGRLGGGRDLWGEVFVINVVSNFQELVVFKTWQDGAEKSVGCHWYLVGFWLFSSKTRRSHACFFQQKKIKYAWDWCVLETKIKKSEKKKDIDSIVYSWFWTFSVKNTPLSCLFKKKLNGHESGMFFECKQRRP